MMIAVVTSKFKIWKDEGTYKVTSSKRQYVVYEGTYEGAMDFVDKHPHGLTMAEAIGMSEELVECSEVVW